MKQIINNDFYINDLQNLKYLLSYTNEQLADALKVSRMTLDRWMKGKNKPSSRELENIYSFAYRMDIDLNSIKTQLIKEDNISVLFHGSKSTITTNIDLKHNTKNNDFGNGFYLGETYEQSASFISNTSSHLVYVFTFDTKGLKKAEYKVDQEWMITIAYFRGRLQEYENSTKLKQILAKLKNVDYIVAPIADNNMYQIINKFINSEISDEQCKHALSATNLGMQYILLSDKAIEKLKLVTTLYVCDDEKRELIQNKNKEIKTSQHKIQLINQKYYGKGKLIGKIL